MRYDFHEVECKVREYWEKYKLPEKLTKPNKKKPKFYLLDGPPYVNAEPHVGHVKTTTFKDIWSKFKLMQGFSSWFQPGFDCHGLPVENMVERELGIKSKRDIVEKVGVNKFMELCRKKATGNEEFWLELYRQLGAWRGYLKPYMTLENYYIESAWWSLKKMAERGLLYEGEKPTYWCPHCQTALAGYEVTDSYMQLKDPYVYVKFPIEGSENEYIVIFTTTPWTLVSNVAIAVRDDENYVKVKYKGEILIIAEKRLEAVEELCKEKFEIVEKIPGKELEGLRYLPVINAPVQHELHENPKAHRIYLSIPVLKSKSYKHGVLEDSQKMKGAFFDFVNMDEGSGAVHVAPGHGPEDYYLGQHYRLPVVSPIDDAGCFTEEAGLLAGKFVLDASKLIVEDLESRGYLLYNGIIEHSYPVCWRCKTPLIFRLTKQWFIAVEPIKEKMLEENEKVRWLPEFGKERFRNWLINASDWCISRQRYWGIPLPIWRCENCGDIEVIGSIKELEKKAKNKLPEKLDLHKHVVDTIELKCGKCNGTMKRVPDILDVWFDSGVAAWASLGYPYRNKELFEWLWPVDLIDESQDQIRGWFYSTMFCSVAVFDEAPYKAVAMNGWVLDEKGEKMSKSLGNVIWGKQALKELGADTLRLYYCWGNAPWEQQNFSIQLARKEIGRTLNILWNSYQFFRMYAPENFKPNYTSLKVEDKWLLSRTNSLVKEITKCLENFEFNRVGRIISNFIVEDMSRFYIKLIRDRVSLHADEKDKVTALSVLYEALFAVVRLLAPVAPFISEYLYQELRGSWKGKSVYELKWPEADESKINEALEKEVEVARTFIDAILAARQKAGVKLRWPLREVKIDTTEPLERTKELICTLSNIYSVNKGKAQNWVAEKTKFGTIYLNAELDEELLSEAMLRELTRFVQELRKKHGFNVKESIHLTLQCDRKAEKMLEPYLEKLSKEVNAEQISFGKLEGEFKGELEFKDHTIRLAFSRIRSI